MVTYFNISDLLSFGKYLLSDKRKYRFEKSKSTVPLEDRLSGVHREDIENWKASIGK